MIKPLFCLLFLLCSVLIMPLAKAAIHVTERSAFTEHFDQPTTVTVDDAGRMTVLDGLNRRLVMLSPTGKLEGERVLNLDHPLDMIAVEGGQWLIADTGQHRLVRVDPRRDVAVETFSLMPPEPGTGEEQAAPAAPATGRPEPVALAVIADRIYWADRSTHRICHFRLNRPESSACFGGRGERAGQLQYPYQMAVDPAGYLSVIDILNARIQIFDKTGRLFSQVGRFGIAEGELYRPTGLALDSEHERLFVSDAYFGTISVFERGEYQGRIQTLHGEVLTLDTPSSLTFRGGQLYVVETGASRVLRLKLDFTPKPAQKSSLQPVELSEKNCVQCHLSWAQDAPAALRGKDANGVLPEASFKMCYSCHQGPIMDSRSSIHRGGQHPSLYESDREKQRHARQGPRRDKVPELFPRIEQALTCTSCHTPHTDTTHADTLYQGHGNPWLRVLNQGGDLCERCHASKGKDARPDTAPSRRGHNHPLGIRLMRPPSVHAQGYASQSELQHGLPTALLQAGAVTGPQDTLICQSCHQIHGGVEDGILTALPQNQGALCTECHARQTAKSREEAHRKGIHPVNFKLEKPIEWQGNRLTEITCATCHPVHQGTVGTSLLPEGIAQAEALCQGCHQRQHAENREQARYKGIHPVNLTLDEAVTINGKRQDSMTCLTCHAVHNGKPDTAALVETDRDGELCSFCHAHKQTVVGTDHDLRITAKDQKNAYDQLPAHSGVCGTCHTLHRGPSTRPALSAIKPVAPQPASGSESERVDDTVFQRDRLCLNCHQAGGVARKKPIRHFSHPHDTMVLRSNAKKMPLLDQNEKNQDFGQIACVTCHEPHVFDPAQKSPTTPKITLSSNRDNLEGTHSDSFLRLKGVSGSFCIDCHGQEGLVKYQYFHDPQRARGKGLDYFDPPKAIP